MSGDVSTLRMLDQIETQYLLRLREDREEVKRTATEVGVMGEGDMRRRLDKDQVQFDAGADSLNCDSSFRSDYLLIISIWKMYKTMGRKLC